MKLPVVDDEQVDLEGVRKVRGFLYGPGSAGLT